ncbi:MAG: CAP domain-containing protein [Terracidiphilus sp.]
MKIRGFLLALGALALLVLTLPAPALRAQSRSQPQSGPVTDIAQPDQLTPDGSNQLIALVNKARAAAGLGPVEWDPALAAAAEQHCLLMSQKGPIEHRYNGEPSLTDRAAAAGAHFSVIEENIAIGPSAQAIGQEWLHSPPHRANMLNPDVNRIGTAIVSARGTLFAVADFSRAVLVLSQSQVEAQVANLIRVSGVSVLTSPAQARQACTTGAMPPSAPGLLPRFLMLWQSSSLKQLPKSLGDKLVSGQYHRAEVGSCAPQSSQNGFAAYRVAVLLY